MDNGVSKAHAPWLGIVKSCSSPLLPSPFSFEAGACSKHSQNKPSLGSKGPIVEDGKLESSTSSPSSILYGASASVFPASSVLDSPPPWRTTMAQMVDLGSISSISAPKVPSGSGSSVQASPSWLTPPPPCRFRQRKWFRLLASWVHHP